MSFTRNVPVSVWIAITAIAVFLFVSSLSIGNPRGLWTVSPDPPEHRLWAFTQEQFGESDVLLATFRLPPGREVELESAALTLQTWIQGQPEVTHVLGVVQLMALRERMGPFGGSLLADLRRAVIATNDNAALTYVVLSPPTESGSLDVKSTFIGRLRAASSDLLPAESELHLAGQPAIDIALDRLLREDFNRTVPIALAAIGLVLVVLIGRLSVAAVLTVSVALIVVLGGMAALAVPVSSATAVALPLTVIVGVSYSGHVALAVARTHDAGKGVRELRAPLFWSFVTTAVALGAFAVAPIRALRLFAFTACAGLTVAFLGALTFTPFICSGTRRAASKQARRSLTEAGIRVFLGAARRRSLNFLLWAVLATAIGAGVFKVRIEPNSYLSFFPATHPIALAYGALDHDFGGSIQLQVLARADSGVACWQRRVRARLNSFLRDADTLTRLGPSLVPPPTQVVGGNSDLRASVERWFQGKDARYTRAMFAVPILDTQEARRLVTEFEALAAFHSDQQVTLSVTGLLPASLPMQQTLVELMVRSMGLLAAFVLVALVVATRSATGGLVLLLPNALAVLAVVASMGHLGIPIDFTTVSVTSLVLGVAVDDTLQIAWAGRTVRGRPYRPSQAVKRTAAPVLLGTLAMAAGALTLTLSPFPPTQRLGGLLAVGLAVALLADLTLTPILIGNWQRSRRAGGDVC